MTTAEVMLAGGVSGVAAPKTESPLSSSRFRDHVWRRDRSSAAASRYSFSSSSSQ